MRSEIPRPRGPIDRRQRPKSKAYLSLIPRKQVNGGCLGELTNEKEFFSVAALVSLICLSAVLIAFNVTILIGLLPSKEKSYTAPSRVSRLATIVPLSDLSQCMKLKRLPVTTSTVAPLIPAPGKLRGPR